ncbi:MAG: ABC transporter ATP-binding protein [Anaerolineae bacterium]|nr:ABC transporter ATP-binding protein [Anaerolineae bacterium]
MTQTESIVRTEGLSKRYDGDAPVQAVNDVSLAVSRGEFVAVQGPSGSGKSTLLNLIGTLDAPTAGRVVVDDVDISTLRGDALADFRRRTIGFVFQLFNLVPTLTALENVMLPLIPYRRGLKFDLQARSRELLGAVGLENRGNHLPGQLSGGEQQRVAIARALINHPRLILADEPTGNLDSKAGEEVVQLLRQLNRDSGITILLVTHDSSVAACADRIVHFQDGSVVQSQA